MKKQFDVYVHVLVLKSVLTNREQNKFLKYRLHYRQIEVDQLFITDLHDIC